MSVYYGNGAVRGVGIGYQVETTAAVVASGSSADLFTVDGGNVWLLGLVGVVETVLVADTDLSIEFDPDDAGADVTLASTLIADSDPTGTVYALNPTAGGALVATTDVGYNTLLATPILLTAGDVKLSSAGAGAGGGSIHWYAQWVAADAAAVLTAS